MKQPMKNRINEIENVICGYTGVTPQDIINSNKGKYASIARSMLWYVLHTDYDISIGTLSNTYLRKHRNIYKRIADIRYNVTHIKLYEEMHNDIIKLINEKGIKYGNL